MARRSPRSWSDASTSSPEKNAEAAGRVRALDGWTLLCPMTRPSPRSRSYAFFRFRGRKGCG
jgi:hypothetical protein